MGAGSSIPVVVSNKAATFTITVDLSTTNSQIKDLHTDTGTLRSNFYAYTATATTRINELDTSTTNLRSILKSSTETIRDRVQVNDEGVPQGNVKVIDYTGTDIAVTVSGDTATVTSTPGAGGSNASLQSPATGPYNLAGVGSITNSTGVFISSVGGSVLVGSPTYTAGTYRFSISSGSDPSAAYFTIFESSIAIDVARILTQNLRNCNTIDTDTDGQWACGTDESGGGGGGGGLNLSFKGGTPTNSSTVSLTGFGAHSITFDGAYASATIMHSTNPYVEVPISVAALLQALSSGSVAVTSTQTPTNRLMFDQMTFKNGEVQGSRSHAYFDYETSSAGWMGWDGSTVAFSFKWYSSSGTANGWTRFCAQAVTLNAGDLLDTAYGSSVCVQSQFIGTNRIQVSTMSAAITVGNGSLPGGTLHWRIFRDPFDGQDNHDAFMHLLGFKFRYRRNTPLD